MKLSIQFHEISFLKLKEKTENNKTNLVENLVLRGNTLYLGFLSVTKNSKKLLIP